MNTPAGRIGAIVRILIWALVAVIFASLLGVLLLKNSFSFNFSLFGSAYSYSNAGSYTVGAGTVKDKFHSIDIDWIRGNVEIEITSSGSASLRETGQGTEEKDALRWKVENGTLIIKFSAPRGIFDHRIPSKDLVLSLPEALVKDMNRITIDSVSAPITLPAGIHASDFSLESVSGDIETGLISGNALSMNSISGKIRCKGEFSTARFETVSGGISFGGKAGEVEADSVSGSMDFDLDNSLQKMDIDTVSGDVTLSLPSDSNGASVDFDTTSGSFSSDFSYITKDKDEFIIENGFIHIDAESVSGDLSIKKKR